VSIAICFSTATLVIVGHRGSSEGSRSTIFTSPVDDHYQPRQVCVVEPATGQEPADSSSRLLAPTTMTMEPGDPLSRATSTALDRSGIFFVKIANLVAPGILDKMDAEAFARGNEWAFGTTLTVMHAVLRERQGKVSDVNNKIQFCDL
jgi:hypothetical protein